MVSESRQSFGKRQEFAAIAEMLKLGLDVYMTLVDDRGIDCIVREDANTYYDVQIKARGRNVKYPGYFTLYVPEPRPNYFFVLYSEEADKVWVIPSERITGSDDKDPLGKLSKGNWYVDAWYPYVKEKDKEYYAQFEQYENAWHYLGAKKDL
ncbi:MAG: hypothetical protein ACE5IE_04115 [Dehalococcoidia bacterium]